MEQQGKKKEWVAPELLVLARSHPEEAVLAGCKGYSPGPNTSWCEVSRDVFCNEDVVS